MREIRFELMRPQQIIEERLRCPLIYVPFGTLEWHGPHLPIGTDMLIAHNLALRSAKETGGVVFPPLFLGAERERSSNAVKDLGFTEDQWIVGIDFPKNTMKSLYIQEEYLALFTRIILDHLVNQGYKLIAMINGHGATCQIDTLLRLANEFTHEKNIDVLFFYQFVADERGNIDFGHANAAETSKVMAIFPNNVDLKTLPTKDIPIKYQDFAIVDSDAFLGKPDPNFEVKDDPRVFSSSYEGEKSLQNTANKVIRKVKEKLVEMNIPN